MSGPESRAAITADHAAERVDAGRHARLAHPLGDQIGRGPMCRSEVKPGQIARLVADGRQLDQTIRNRLAERARFRRLHRVHGLTLSCALMAASSGLVNLGLLPCGQRTVDT